MLRVIAAILWPTINDVQTGATPEYPDIQAQHFAQPADKVFSAALATARDMELEVTNQSSDKNEIRAVATTRVFRFKDDVTISVARKDNFTLVDVRSRSRIGKGDLGANARRIRDFQARLAGKL